MTEGSGIGPAVGAYFLRGIGSGRSGIDDEPPVGLYLDGVFLGTFDGSLLQVVKPKRIEVLRGPQGTLFGKNALGGAVQYISQEPLFNETTGEIEASFGSFSRVDLTAYYNMPINEDMALRITGASFKRDGNVNRGDLPNANDTGTDFIRADFLWSLNPDFTARFAVDFSSIKNNGGGNVIRSIDPTDRRMSGYISRGFDLRNYLVDDRYANRSTSPTYIDGEQSGVSLTLDWNLNDDWSVKSISSYRENNQDSWIDRDGTPYQYFEQIDMRQHEQWTQELQLALNTDRLTWIMGLYHFDESPFNNRQRLEEIERGNGILHEIFEESNQSSAIYTEGTYFVSEQFSLTLGARYTWEDKMTSTISYREGAEDDLVHPVNSDDFNAFTPRVVAQMQWTPEVMSYISYSEGFKSGGFNTRYNPTLPANGFVPYDEEYLNNYEAGMRSQWLDNRLRFNATLFHSVYTDRQITQLTDLDTLLISNGGEAEYDGLEIEGEFLLTPNFKIDFGLGKTKSKVTDVGRSETLVVGESVGNTPKWSYNLAAQYNNYTGNGGQLVYRLSYGWKDKREIGVENNSTVQPSYGLLTARLTYRNPDDDWRVTVFGTNLTNEEYLTQSQNSRGLGMAVYSDPRQYGISVAYSF